LIGTFDDFRAFRLGGTEALAIAGHRSTRPGEHLSTLGEI
jgi:hypothetical protein